MKRFNSMSQSTLIPVLNWDFEGSLTPYSEIGRNLIRFKKVCQVKSLFQRVIPASELVSDYVARVKFSHLAVATIGRWPFFGSVKFELPLSVSLEEVPSPNFAELGL